MLRIALVVLAVISPICAEDALPEGYIRGEYSHRVILEHASECRAKRSLEVRILMDVRQHPQAKELHRLMADSKIAEAAHSTSLDVDKVTKESRTAVYFPLFRVALAIDSTNADSEMLLEPKATAKLATSLGEVFRGFPQPELFDGKMRQVDVMTTWGLPPNDYFSETRTKKGSVRNDLTEHSRCLMELIAPVVKQWQDDAGVPYHVPKDAVMHLWCFHDYLTESEVGGYLEKNLPLMANTNKVDKADRYEFVNLTDLATSK